MELVLSPGGNGSGDAGSPFRNEDVREWSRVDRITGMLERARVETDRWHSDTQDAKQSYGKMTDSRVRNSADGSLVQKARRQVEIFQSQGNGGRNFQVVRASQWSSSKATDCALDVTSNKLDNTRYINDTMNGDKSFDSSRLSLWRPSLADTASDLDRLSYLCRKLHDEAMSNASFWPLNSLTRASRRSTSSSLMQPLDVTFDSNRFEEIENGIEFGVDDRLSLGERRSNSNEDLSSLLSNGDDTFTRDCKTRRSLQITNNLDNANDDKAEDKIRRCRAELIAERAKRFEEGITRDNGVKKSFISTKTFTPIANNDFVKNDPKHPSKFHQIAKISIQDNVENSHRTMHISSPQPQRRVDTASIPTRKANNKTVVHLRNVASPDAQLPRCINVMAVKLEKDKDLVENGARNNRLMESSTKDETTTTQLVNGTKPVKKVEFCKTEIHFAADSGKVNIVETDGKPPPTNKFRRRRRNHSLNSVIGSNPQKSNLPVVHFGDTSYEKYIFGGGKVPPSSSPRNENKTDNSPLAAVAATTSPITTTAAAAAAAIADNVATITDESSNNNFEVSDETLDKWSDAIPRDSGTSKEIVTKDSFTDTSLDKVMEHVGKFKGAHTTTVNFLSDESNKARAKVTEDEPNCTSFNVPTASPTKAQLLSKDSDQVVLKVVTTHKPIVARVDEHPPGKSSKLKNQTDEEKVKNHKIDDTQVQVIKQCDNSTNDTDEPPVYENIFDAVTDGAPLYENFHRLVKTIPVDMPKEKAHVKKASIVDLHGKVATKINNDSGNKMRSVRSITPKSEKEVSNVRSRDNSVKRRNDGKKDDATRCLTTKKIQERKATPTNLVTDKNALKTKKPVEVVYKTAVYNMKNEKLSKSTKSKETKGPRLINELICGTKMKKPSDGKKITKMIVPQSNSKKKNTTTVVNR